MRAWSFLLAISHILGEILTESLCKSPFLTGFAAEYEYQVIFHLEPETTAQTADISEESMKIILAKFQKLDFRNIGNSDPRNLKIRKTTLNYKKTKSTRHVETKIRSLARL